MHLKITLSIDEKNPNAKMRCFTELSGGNLKHYIRVHEEYIKELEQFIKELKIVLKEFKQKEQNGTQM